MRKTVIVDEASMLDSWLLKSILDFEPPQLILVGDPAQLPPVGRGQPFHDITALRSDIVHTLTHCWRANGAVHIAAQAVRTGDSPPAQLISGGESWKMLSTGDAAHTTRKLMQWVEAGHYDPAKDVILSSRYGNGEDDGGIDAINGAVKSIVNPSAEKYAVNDRIIITKNDAENDNWNGDLATVVDIDTAGRLEVVLDRNGQRKFLPRGAEYDLAYCLSVHKSQGSQWRNLFFVVLRSHWFQMCRSLVYTAITRAQQGVCVMGQLEVFAHGISVVKQKQTVMQKLAEWAT